MKKLESHKWEILMAIVLLTVMFVFYDQKITKPICPDDFNDPREEIASMGDWLGEFIKTNPEASQLEISRARVDFLIDNDCKEAIRRTFDYMSGNSDEETRQLIKLD